MLEALIVYTVTVFLLFLILAIFFVLFQRWNIQTVANEAAAKIAQVYKLTDCDITTGETTEAQIADVRPYRYMFNKEDPENAAEKKVVEYAKDRLKRTTFTKDVTEPEFDFEVVSDSLGRRHIEFTVSGEYSVPFGEALSYFGFPGTTTYEVTACADCVDLIDYITTIDYVNSVTSLKQFGSDTLGMIDKILSLVDNIIN